MPFLEYGTGIQMFFMIQERLIYLFLGLSFLAFLQMVIFAFMNDDEFSLVTSFTFVSMGYSGNSCGVNFIDWSQDQTRVSLQCQGTTRIRKVLQSGLAEYEEGQIAENEEKGLYEQIELNRCYYPRPVDYTKFPIMSHYDGQDGTNSQ